MSGDTAPLHVSLLHKYFLYDADTGLLSWRKRTPDMLPGNAVCGREGECAAWNTRYAGTQAFVAAGSNGYHHGTVAGRALKAHRIAWAMTHGRWPTEVDHINGDRSDNRIANLREVNRQTNSRNRGRRSDNSSGVVGVRCVQGRWKARIHDNGKERHLGTFTSREAATAAWREAAERLGYHANHGRA